MKKIAWILLVVLGVTAYFLCPQNAASKARFCPPETPETITNSWTVIRPVKQIDDGQDDIFLKAGGEGMATTGFLTRSNGQTVTINLTGKKVLSAKVRFRGVNGSVTSYEYKTVTDSASYVKSGGQGSQAYLDPPPVPTGYAFDRITITTSVSSSVSGDWYITADVGEGYAAFKSGTGTSGSVSKYTSDSSYLSTNAGGSAEHSEDHKATFTVATRGKKAVTTTTYSTDPSCAGGKHSGTLTGGTVSSWYTASLASDKVNTLTVSVGGSGKVDVEIEYTYENIKLPQPAPSAPSVSNLTPTSVTLTSDAGSLIVCNGETKASGSTWSGLSEQTSYSAYAYLPETDTHLQSPASGSTSFTTPSSSGPPSVQTLSPTDIGYTSAVIRGNVSSANGATPTRYFRWGYSSAEMEFIIDMGTGTGSYSIELSGLEAGQKYYYQAYAVNTYGTGRGATLSFETPYPTLPPPEKVSPPADERTQDRRPWLTFVLTALAANPAETYHARARISESSTMVTPIFDSTSGNDWQYWDGAAWQTFPAEGVTPGTKVRCRPPIELGYKTYYWDCASFDGTVWGEFASATSFRILVVVVGNYYLDIEGAEWLLYSLKVQEASNGEIGKIIFAVDLVDDLGRYTNDLIKYGDTVTLGVNDGLGNTDEFRGIIRGKSPQAEELVVTAFLGDGILSERRCKQDYASQDIGLTVKAIIETYCQPLTAVNVDTATGFVAPVAAKDKTPLRVLEEIRRRYGVFYFVDKDWDLHFMKPESMESAIVQIQYGDNGINLMGAM